MANFSASLLNQAIDRHPLTVTPDTAVTEAIALMSRAQASCVVVVQQQVEASDGPPLVECTKPASGEVRGSPLLGIFTERDVVRVTASGADMEGVSIAAVMTRSIVTITESEARDILTVLNLFRQHQIRHLPIIDEFGQLAGIITPTSLLVGTREEKPRFMQNVSFPLKGLATSQKDNCDLGEPTPNPIELRESQEKYKVLFEILPIGIAIADKAGNIIEANTASEKILGLSIEEHKTRKCDSAEWQFLRHDGTPMPAEESASVRALKENRLIENIEMGIVKEGNKITWISVSATQIPLSDYGVAIAYVDITERKQALVKLEKSLSLLRATLESTADGIIAGTREGEIVSFNQRFVEMWQIPDAIVTSPDYKHWLNFLLDRLKDPEAFKRRLVELYGQPEAKACDILELKNGKIFERHSLPHKLGEEIIKVWSFRDITEQKRTESALRSSVERELLLGRIIGRIRRSLQLDKILKTAVAEVRSFLQAERVALYRIEQGKTAHFIIESHANTCESVLGISIDDRCFETEYIEKYKIGCVSAVDDIYTADLSPCYINLLESIGIRANLLVPLVVNKQLWGIICVHECSKPRHWEPFEIELLQQLATGLAIAIQQSSLFKQLQEANLELQHRASLDSLTQLANRRRFDEYLDLEWRRQAREQAPLSLILCDIDCFKIYNDTYGHQAGDLCLRQVAGAIRLAVRRPADLVARYGGEEIVVVLPNTPTAGAIYIAESIRSLIKDLQIVHVHSPVSPYVTLSLGVASIVPRHNSSAAALIAAADEALYHAKIQGRDRVKSVEL